MRYLDMKESPAFSALSFGLLSVNAEVKLPAFSTLMAWYYNSRRLPDFGDGPLKRT